VGVRLTIAHLYPREMNLYGDAGNIRALVQRLRWRGHDAEVAAVEVGEPFDLAGADLVFGSGGQDSGQAIVGPDLLARGDELRAAVAAGVPVLAICGLFQLFGHGYTPLGGGRIPGIGVFDVDSVGGGERVTGNVVLDTALGRVVGFENHSGRTVLAPGQAAFGRVVRGVGNDTASGLEGARTGAAIGTYLHGPVLPTNPHLADHLLAAALRRRGVDEPLAPLDDTLELAVAEAAAARPRRT